MISTKLTVPRDVADVLEGLTGQDLEDILTDAAEGYCGPGGVLEQHFNQGQAEWGEPDARYQDKKEQMFGNSEKFVKTGAAKDAIKTGKSPYLQKSVSKTSEGVQIDVALVRIENGRNIYSIAQAGGRGNGGPPMRITQALPGDEEIIIPYVEASCKSLLMKKGIL